MSLKGRALRHLARREHSRAELERKLLPHVEASEAVNGRELLRGALDDLAARGLQSDERAAESALHRSLARVGSRRLRHDLLAKGLNAELVAATVARARATEFDRAWALWQRRFGAAPSDATERARQARFLAGRGFEADVVRRVLRLADSGDGHSPE